MVTASGLLPVWSTIAFWSLAKPFHLTSMLSKSMRCSEYCIACSCRRSTERARFSSTSSPSHTSDSQHFKSWITCTTKFCLIYRIHLSSHQPTTVSSSISAFCRQNFYNQQKAENILQEFMESWSSDFYATGINKLTSYWHKCIYYNGSYFD